MKKINLALIATVVVFSITSVTLASVGVGINLGKIEIDDPLKPGGIYNFPSIGVINTGDEAGEYEMEITYHQDQPELMPAKEWFNFEPQKFHLESGQSQSVAVKLILPVKAKTGDYFAYLEAHPIIKSKGGGATIGVAAATKAYFSVAPANLWSAIIFRISSFFAVYSPWSYVVLVVIVGAIIIAIIRKHFAFQFGIRRK